MEGKEVVERREEGRNLRDAGAAVAAISVPIAEPGFLQKGTWCSETSALTPPPQQRAQVSQSLTMINSKAGTLMLNDPPGKDSVDLRALTMGALGVIPLLLSLQSVFSLCLS